MALSLHYYGVGGRDEQHARIDYRPTPQALLVDLPDDMKDQVRHMCGLKQKGHETERPPPKASMIDPRSSHGRLYR